MTVRRLLVTSVLVAVAWTPGPAGPADPPLPVGGLTALPGAQAPGPNLVANGSFETAASSSPAKWTLRPAEVWSVAGEGHSGRHALKLTRPETAGYVPHVEQEVTLEPGLYTLEAWVKSADLGARDPNSGVRVCLDGRPRLSWWQCTEVARGSADWRVLRRPSIPVAERGAYRVAVGAYGAADGTAWIDDVSLTALQPPPLDVFLLYPNFRGLLFDDRPQTVRVAVEVRRAPEGARVRLALLDGRSAAAARREYPATGAFTGELDAAGLPAAVYTLRAELLDAAGAVLHAYPDHRVVKTPARLRERLNVWYDERNVVSLSGKRTFPLGLYTTGGYSTTRSTYARGTDGWGIDRMAEAPINMLINYHLGRAPVPALTTYMDELHSRGIHYLQTANFYSEDDPQYREIDYPAARHGADALNRWVAQTLGGHRGLAGLYTADERPAEAVPTVFRQYRTVAAALPGSVTYAVLGDGWERQAPLWRDAADVIGLDPYPIVKPAGQNDLAMVGEWTRLGREAVKGSRPLWMVIQYFPLTGVGGWPTEDELRRMSWMAIVDGATGLFYWSFGEKGLAWVKDPAQKERKWAELVRVTKEIRALEPVLLAPDVALVKKDSSVGRVRTLGKQGPDGTRYVFAYNTTNAPVKATWTLAAAAVETLDLATGTPGPRPADGQLTVEFGPFEVKRLRLR